MAKRAKASKAYKRDDVLLFLVEGDTDQRSLEYSIEAFLDKNGVEGVKVKFTRMMKQKNGEEQSGGDATSDMGIYEKNIEEQITRRIDYETEEGNYIYPKQVVKMIQIIDLDGAYVPDESVIERENRGQKENRGYFDYYIETDNKLSTIKNLQRKRKNIDYLTSKKTFKLKTKTVEYSIYYFSTNLEHFLYGKQNLNSYEKSKLSRDFAYKCMDEPNAFYKIMHDSPYAMSGKTYEESWDYIKEIGLCSLSRCSNINLLFSDLLEWAERYKTIELTDT